MLLKKTKMFYLLRNVKEPSDLIESLIILRETAYPCLFGIVTSLALHYFISNKYIRRAAKHLFFPVQIVPVLENTQQRV